MNTRSPQRHLGGSAFLIRATVVVFTALLVSTTKSGRAEDWGAYRIVSASTPDFVLEAVGGAREGAVVSIQKPTADANQKWVVIPVDGAVKVAAAGEPSDVNH